MLLVDKPADWTSQDVCSKLRGALHERRIGHSGTLDPMATGLLVVFVGRATRAVSFAETHDKRYLFSLRPGLVTDTQDITGTVLQSCPTEITEAELLAVLPEFLGTLPQIPPMYSALKRDGKKLCDIARRGGTVALAPRPVQIRSLTLLGRENGDFQLSVSCGKGTYVRTLCHDIGARLGCGGCLSALRRTEAGPFRIEQAHTLPEILDASRRGAAESLLLPVDTLFSEALPLTLDAAAEKQCRVGAAIPLTEPAGRYRAYGQDGAFLALLEGDGTRAVTVKSFFEV